MEFESASALLADRCERRQCAAVVARGGQYYEGPADRDVIREAIGVLKARGDRRSRRGIAQKALAGDAGRIARLAEQRRAERQQAADQRTANRIAAGKLGAGRVRSLYRRGELLRWAKGGHGRDRQANTAGLVRCVVRTVGPIGEQCERDLAHFDAGEDFDGKRGRHHKLEGSELERIEALVDWSAVLITMCDYCSYGSCGWDGYESRGGRSYRCYLVVRDSSTGEAHCLRVPPKFGNAQTQFFGRFRSPRERIQAAVAWTFGMEAREYRPAVQA